MCLVKQCLVKFRQKVTINLNHQKRMSLVSEDSSLVTLEERKIELTYFIQFCDPKDLDAFTV